MSDQNFLYFVENFLATFFVAATKNNKFAGKCKYEGLFHFIVATKCFHQNFLQHHVGARAKKFWRARTPTLRNLHRKMLKKCVLRVFSTGIPKCWSVRAPKIFHARTNMMLKKISVKQFCCYDKMQQPLIISLTRKFVVFCCCNKKMLQKKFSTT